MVKQILKDSHSEREHNWLNLKKYMQKFDNKSEWIDKVRTSILA
jgi:hypothetical protein